MDDIELLNDDGGNDWKEQVQYVLQYRNVLNEWEREFIGSLQRIVFHPTDKQLHILGRLVNEVWMRDEPPPMRKRRTYWNQR